MIALKKQKKNDDEEIQKGKATTNKLGEIRGQSQFSQPVFYSVNSNESWH